MNILSLSLTLTHKNRTPIEIWNAIKSTSTTLYLHVNTVFMCIRIKKNKTRKMYKKEYRCDRQSVWEKTRVRQKMSGRETNKKVRKSAAPIPHVLAIGLCTGQGRNKRGLHFLSCLWKSILYNSLLPLCYIKGPLLKKCKEWWSKGIKEERGNKWGFYDRAKTVLKLNTCISGIVLYIIRCFALFLTALTSQTSPRVLWYRYY